MLERYYIQLKNVILGPFFSGKPYFIMKKQKKIILQEIRQTNQYEGGIVIFGVVLASNHKAVDLY